MNFTGIIVEESLENKTVLKKVKIISTEVEKVTLKHKTSWIKQWTMHTVEIAEDQIDKISKEISKALDTTHQGNWYADFKNNQFHYIIFKNKIFKVNRTKPEQYKAVTEYGLSLGIPKHQLDFSPQIK